VLNVLLTNDDGIEAEGLHAMRAALAALPDLRLVVIAPDGNRSAMARSITTNRPLWVEAIQFADGGLGYATDGTPVDCVRLAALKLIEDFETHVVVSGVNHGNNLGDDITYSGTVAAALEGLVLGLPAIAVSQQLLAREREARAENLPRFNHVAGFVARLVERLGDVPLPPGTLLNVNAPSGVPDGVEVARLGKRIYRDELKLEREEPGPPSRRRYWIYGRDPGFHDEPGTDLAAVAAGRIAVTPLHFDLTYRPGVEPLRDYDLESLLGPAAARPPAQDPTAEQPAR
jgi:5'/3'-nucleotidase